MQPSIDTGSRTGPGQALRYGRFAELLGRPRSALGIAALAFVLSLPAIATGLMADDFDLALAVTRDPLGAYGFWSRDPAERRHAVLAAREAGTAPWWIDVDLHQAFLRPLSSLSLALDFRLWPSAPWLMHVENGLLFAAIVLLAASIYRALAMPARARGVATFFFAMQGAQSMTTGWISGRNTLLATLFGFASIRLFLAARQTGRAALSALSVLAFACALLSAEAGVAALAYVAAYCLCFGSARVTAPDDGRPDKRLWVTPGALGPRLLAAWGFFMVVAGWLVVYKLGGYGAKGFGFYIDPIDDPAGYLLGLLTALPIYLASQLTLPYASSSGMGPLALPIVTGISVAILYVARGLWMPWVREDTRARSCALGAALAVVPLASSPPQDRMVSFVALGICGLLALIVEERLGAVERALPSGGALRLLRYHAIWAPLLYVPFLFGSMSMIAGGGGVLLDRTLGADPRPVVLVNAPSHLPVHFFATSRQWFGRSRPPVDLLYGGGAGVELERTGERSVELSVGRGYFASGFERIGRDPRRRPFEAGDVTENSRMRVLVADVRDGAPTRVRFDFKQPLSALRLYAWSGRELVPLSPPEIGEHLSLSAASAL